MPHRIIIETDDVDNAEEIEQALHAAGVKPAATKIREVGFDE